MMAFHTRMGDIQAAVSRRERVLVRSHGRPRAIVVAGEGYKPESPKAQDFVAAGMWVDREDMPNHMVLQRGTAAYWMSSSHSSFQELIWKKRRSTPFERDEGSVMLLMVVGDHVW